MRKAAPIEQSSDALEVRYCWETHINIPSIVCQRFTAAAFEKGKTVNPLSQTILVEPTHRIPERT